MTTYEWKYTEPDQDNVCYTDFKAYSDDQCANESDTLLKGAADLLVKKCDAANKVLLLKCGEEKLDFIEGSPFGANCNDAKISSQTPS